MTREDQVLALFAEANPVSDPSALVVDTETRARLEAAEQWSEPMEEDELRTVEPSASMRSRRAWLLGASAAVLVLVVGIGGVILTGGPSDVGGSGSVGTGVLTVDGVDYDFDVVTCDLVGYVEPDGDEVAWEVAGIGSKDGRTYDLFAGRSWDIESNLRLEVIDLDYRDGDDGLYTAHEFSARAIGETLIMLEDGVSVVESVTPVTFFSDEAAQTPAGQGTIAISCP